MLARKEAIAAALAAGQPAPVFATSKKKTAKKKAVKPAAVKKPAAPRKSAADIEFESWRVVAPAAVVPSTEPIVVAEPAPRSNADWHNPQRMTGDALRQYGHRAGLSLSAMAAMNEDKIRQEIAYIDYRRSSGD